jgi:hypothetical protein
LRKLLYCGDYITLLHRQVIQRERFVESAWRE